MKFPHMQFYTGDWLKDPRLSLCAPASRGIWVDLLCAMHELDRSGELRGTSEELARLARCTTVQLEEALTDLQTKQAADVEKRNGSWSVANRRMKREADTREKRKQAGSTGGSKSQAKREQNPDIDNDNGIERVREFSREKGISLKDAEWFYWKGRGNGWTNGGKPMLDWKATLLSWQRAGYLPSQKNQRNGAREDKPAPLDRNKIDLPELFKSWAATAYPAKREQIMAWRTWGDVPDSLRQEWWGQKKKELPIEIS